MSKLNWQSEFLRELLLAYLFTLVSAPAVFGQPSGSLSGGTMTILFNSDWLESAWLTRKPVAPESVLRQDSEADALDLTDKYRVVEFVLSHCKSHSIVYPTEQYFYFKFFAGHRLISGNLRFCDSVDGKVHFGYFDEHDQSFIYWGTIENGVHGIVRKSGDEISLNFRGLQRQFVLDRSRATETHRPIVDGEEIVSQILDESGYCFWLVFNGEKRRFYYVCNEARVPERQVELHQGGYQFVIGLYSRFIFFNDADRQRIILVGVLQDNIRKNNYYDGPFDQVPPRLALKSKLEHVYPYVKKSGGIDEHGNFLTQANSRVAISPYVQYANTTRFLTMAASVVDPASETFPFIDLVYESKMDFHRVLADGYVKSEADEAEVDEAGGSSLSDSDQADTNEPTAAPHENMAPRQ